MESKKTDEQLAEEYDNEAYAALADPNISEGLANQIARVSKNTAAKLRGWQGPGPGRKPNIEKGLPSRSVLFQVRVTPEEAERLREYLQAIREHGEV